ncbi:MAG: AAA domain-containing protein [Candidatus Aminicenantes bacterium]|nr:AAA domain-containing protein [Candidatus Aminicenantes bacterium]NIM82540.1 AAA domain-containing protein [Candidatus Aminicenantes bacterium]NIN21900.1 AAA domain-containing protein [Candidatus Aminicenantes bacterium]NIN45678.1 AAA domain-containing protein [Candidatus Aminicenantes bacterium]NIN88513.1 AAA domain-containing protein [Candidatus Aminicenantes bacterium]
MIENIKTKLWDLLKEKEVSLVMLYNKDGEILWHKGRAIIGKTIDEGEGFSKSYIKRTLKNRYSIEQEDVIISSTVSGLPESARALKVKCLMIQPVSNNFYLYIDSGIKESFTQTDREIFKFMGELLEEMIEQIKENESPFGGITGDSEEIGNIRELVLKYSLEEEPILLLGETGIGKSHIAELIHKYSGRKGKFLTIHTPGIPESLFESEIFGHKKGAFTDARSDKKGFVDEARGGTLFFDEISEVPISFQAKLLRFIETRKYVVLGEPTERKADVRIVAATNKDLHQAIERKEFREDLYFRLHVLEIEIPPLRKRSKDIKPLVMEMQELLKGKEIGKGFWEALAHYDWPGNIRELITVLTRAGILLDSPITGTDIREIIKQTRCKRAVDQQMERIEQIWGDIQAGKSFWDMVKKPFLDRDLNREEVKEIIRRGLTQANGKYKNLLQLFNLKDSEYKRFMKFLNGNRLNI